MTACKDFELIEVKAEEPDSRAFLLFIQTADAVLKYSDAVLYKGGLSVIKQLVLQLLETNGGTLTPTQIARWTLREKHNITTLIQRMQREGLIKVEPNLSDRRSIRVTLTDKGRAAIQNVLPLAMGIVRQVMSSVSNTSNQRLESSLKTLRKNAFEGLKTLNR